VVGALSFVSQGGVALWLASLLAAALGCCAWRIIAR
jgi:hypothetical protein